MRLRDGEISWLPTKFQSTHPRGVRHFGFSEFGPQWQFQSTHPRGVRHGHIYLSDADAKFQSTHPRGVRLQPRPESRVPPDISIHAPTWGATRSPGGGRTSGRDFNPRTHVGCDDRTGARDVGCENFNPRTHVGCDVKRDAKIWEDFLFQSTHPRGVRLQSL